MTTTYTDHVHLAKPAQGDEDWANEINPNYTALDHIMASDRLYFVSPPYTQGNVFPQGTPTGNARRHFDTIQGAVTEAETLGTWGTDGYAVLIAPGTYNEKVTITKSCSLVGWAGCGSSFYTGAPVKIRGNGSAEAIVKVEPPDSEFVRVGFYALQFENGYDDTNATEITAEPYAIWFAENAGDLGSQSNFATIDRCNLRCQTYGEDNCWQSAVRIRGWWQLNAFHSQLQALTHGGGNNNGWIRRAWDIYGDPVESKYAVMRHLDVGTGVWVPSVGSPPTQYCYALLGNAQVHLAYSRCSHSSASSYYLQSSGNSRTGFADTSPSAADYYNAFASYIWLT